MKAAAKSTFLFLLCSAVAFSSSTANAQTRSQARPQSRTGQATRPSPRTAMQNRPTRTPAATGRPVGPVAVVDVSKIFQNHAGFERAMEGMKKEVQQYEESLRARHQALAKKREELSQWKPGTRDYVTRERAIADETAKLSVDTQMKKIWNPLSPSMISSPDPRSRQGAGRSTPERMPPSGSGRHRPAGARR